MGIVNFYRFQIINNLSIIHETSGLYAVGHTLVNLILENLGVWANAIDPHVVIFKFISCDLKNYVGEKTLSTNLNF